VGQQRNRSLILFVEHLNHLCFFDGSDGTRRQGDGRAHTKGIVCEAKLTKKITHSQDRSNRCWTVVPSGRESYTSFLNVEKRTGWRTLRVDVLLIPIACDLAAQAFCGREAANVGGLVVRALQSSSIPGQAIS
jgi:hypothetical protein